MKQNHLKNKQPPSQTAKEKRNTLLEQIKTLSENYKTNPDDLIELMSFSANFYNYSLKIQVLPLFNHMMPGNPWDTLLKKVKKV